MLPELSARTAELARERDRALANSRRSATELAGFAEALAPPINALRTAIEQAEKKGEGLAGIRERADVTRATVATVLRAAGLPSDAFEGTQRRGRLEDRRVLVVDDDGDNQHLAAYFLEREGAEVAGAADGREGVDAALAATRADRPFHAILMDLQMPKLDGYAALAELRAQGYAGPILAFSANIISDNVERCRKAGFDGFVGKPIDRNLLAETLESLLH